MITVVHDNIISTVNDNHVTALHDNAVSTIHDNEVTALHDNIYLMQMITR